MLAHSRFLMNRRAAHILLSSLLVTLFVLLLGERQSISRALALSFPQMAEAEEAMPAAGAQAAGAQAAGAQAQPPSLALLAKRTSKRQCKQRNALNEVAMTFVDKCTPEFELFL